MKIAAKPLGEKTSADVRAVTQLQLHSYCAVVFEPSDIVEVRRIPGKPAPFSTWHEAHELAEQAERLVADNAQCNIYVGANPRRRRGARGNASVALARTLFADFDGVAIDEVKMRCESAGLPTPTMIVQSGHGAHSYWRLEAAIENLIDWKRGQQDLIALIGSDPAIHNPERIMRLPGFMNVKRMPFMPCHIVEADATRRYQLEELRKIIPARKQTLTRSPRGAGNGHLDTTRHWLGKALARVTIGTRNDTGLWLACQLRDAGVSRADAEHTLREYAQRVPEGDHAYPESEALASVESAYCKTARRPAATRQSQADRAANRCSKTTAAAPRPVLICMRDVKPQRLEWLWRNRIPLGKLALIVGDPGMGKSYLTIDLAARVSTSTRWPDDAECEKGAVLMLSAEDDVADTIAWQRTKPTLIESSCSMESVGKTTKAGSDGAPSV